jgi:hypothetical protein
MGSGFAFFFNDGSAWIGGIVQPQKVLSINSVTDAKATSP